MSEASKKNYPYYRFQNLRLYVINYVVDSCLFTGEQTPICLDHLFPTDSHQFGFT